MTILIFGKNGQLARALIRSCKASGLTCSVIGSTECDLAVDPEAAAQFIHDTTCKAVINASAFTAVDAAETNRDDSHALNNKAPGVMAMVCAEKNIPFIHISTDYVFSGNSQRPYRPQDKINPVNAYGASKAAGERAVMTAGGRAAIIRTSWVYDGIGKNFLTTMMRLGAQHDTLTVVSDQIGRPTYAGHLAEACLRILDNPSGKPKIYHVSDTGAPISWADFARAIFSASALSCEVKDIPTADYPTPAKRPANSVMDVSDFERDFGYPLADWQTGLALALSEI